MRQERGRDDTASAQDTRVAPAAASSRQEIDAFLRRADAVAPAAAEPRLIFSLDATMSRQPTWDLAAELQAEMFDEAVGAGGIAVGLVYFRGLGECRASRFVGDAGRLKAMMARIDCRSGHTQLARVLDHVVAEAREVPVRAFVHVGDALEEDIDAIADRAGALALLGVRAFMFQEGADPVAEAGFRTLARLTGGAHARFEPGAAGRLGALLRAAAAYAGGGMAGLTALSERGGEGARLLIADMARSARS